jgi:hypothetical protein
VLLIACASACIALSLIACIHTINYPTVCYSCWLPSGPLVLYHMLLVVVATIFFNVAAYSCKAFLIDPDLRVGFWARYSSQENKCISKLNGRKEHYSFAVSLTEPYIYCLDYRLVSR